MSYKLIVGTIVSALLFTSCQKKITTTYDNFQLSEGWSVHPNDSIIFSGETVSSSTLNTDDWYKTSIPNTVMGVLTENGLSNDSLFFADNYKHVNKTLFDQSWWFRKEFTLNQINDDQHVLIKFDGISYSANIWLNGRLVASRDSIFGTFRQFEFDITSFVKANNILAIEIFKAQPGDPNIGFADWNPRPLDENMGLFRGVTLSIKGKVKLNHTYVQSKINPETLNEAWLTVGTDIENLTNKKISGELIGTIESVKFSHPIVLNPMEKRTIRLTSDEIKSLHIESPRLWWCNNMGAPELYHLKLKFRANNTISDKDSVTFGIRQIDSYITDRGHRAFKLNGKKLLLKGAGWTDDIFLRDKSQRNEIQVQYVRDMGMNLIRFENFWGNSSNIYDLCDQYGIMAIVGWSCQWEWEAYYGKPCSEEYGCIQNESEIELIAQSFENQVLWLRNHPCIIAWMPGSDMLQKPQLETKYLNFLKKEDDRPYIGAAKQRISPISGNTGTKMAGPYEYVGPNYWYIDTLYGGSFGFNTETGVGAQLPVLESLKKFIPSDKLWPINSIWDYHCTSSTTAMNSLSELTKVMDAKYGKASDLHDFLKKANMINYDGTRAMFEAFRINIDKTTGLVQWMLNSAWPSLYWQLYDYYLIPTPAYYAVKKANQPLQLMYNHKNNSVYVVNELTNPVSNYDAIIRIYNTESKLIKSEKIKFASEPRESKQVYILEQFSENIFLSLEILDDKNDIVANNFYCLSAKQDEYCWDKTNWVHTPAKSYSDLKSLSQLEPVNPIIKINEKEDNENLVYEISLINESNTIALFIELQLKDKDAEIISPVFWSDNYISLPPKQSITLEATVNKKLISNTQTSIKIEGWNVNCIEQKLQVFF